MRSLIVRQKVLDRILRGVPEDERASFLRRLEREPGLQAAVSELEELRAWFGGDRGQSPMPASRGFSASVLAAARRLPTREELRELDIQERDDQTDLVNYARRISFAAAMLIGVALLLFVTAQVSVTTQVEATPLRVEQTMERLDEAIRAESERAGVESRDR